MIQIGVKPTHYALSPEELRVTSRFDPSDMRKDLRPAILIPPALLRELNGEKSMHEELRFKIITPLPPWAIKAERKA